MKWPHALLVAAAALMLATCASSGSTVSTAARPPSAVDGRFLWQDLVTTNATAARAFYSALLGWEFAETTRGGRPYLIARTAAGPVGGLVDIRDIKDAGSQWVTYVAVADIDRTVGQVQAAGGRVIVLPTATSAGRAAVVVDPQGAALGLLQTSREAPADGLKLVNAHFFWREVPRAGCDPGSRLLHGPAGVPRPRRPTPDSVSSTSCCGETTREPGSSRFPRRPSRCARIGCRTSWWMTLRHWPRK